jgi:hypothetical protein
MTKVRQLVQSSGGLLQAFFGVFKELFKYLKAVNRKWNEAWLIVLGFFLWKYASHVMALIDPTVPPLPVNDLMRFVYATIGTCVAHFVVSVMLWLSHPWVFKYLYARFYEDIYAGETPDFKSHQIKHDLKCIRLKYSLLVWLFYLATWLILVATYN